MAAIERTIRNKEIIQVDLVDVVAAGADGLVLTYMDHEPTLPGQLCVSFEGAGLVADGADSVLSVYMYALTHLGNRAENIGNGGFIPLHSTITGFSTVSANATTPHEFFTSATAGAKDVREIWFCAGHAKSGFTGFGLGVVIMADDGADSWTGGEISLSIARAESINIS